MALHSDLTGADLHEPKGVAGASADTVYVADGAGSGTWQKPEAANVSVADASSGFTSTNVEGVLDELFEDRDPVHGMMLDVSTAETLLIPIPFDCTVEKILMILGSTIDADTTITVTRSDGAAMGSQTLTASGSVEGTFFEFIPTGNSTLTYSSHKYVKLVSDGASTTASRLYVLVTIKRD